MVPRQPPPNLLAPYPAIKALNQFGINKRFASVNKKLCHNKPAYYTDNVVYQ